MGQANQARVRTVDKGANESGGGKTYNKMAGKTGAQKAEICQAQGKAQKGCHEAGKADG